MGTKYIIEVEDKPFELLSEYGFTSEKLYRVKGFNSLVSDWNGLNMLTPYTEPDLEQVRKEAYEQGLSDAWEAARKIANMPYDEEEKAFGSGGWAFVEKHTAAEAIEKIRQYEQEQEEQIQVGDEVISPDGKAVVTEISDRNVRIMYSNGSGYVTQLEELTKAGRRFPEIAAVLAKMKEESNEA